MTWYTLYERTLTGGEAWNGWTVRQVIPVAAYDPGAPSTGTQIRVTLEPETGGLNLSKLYVGHAAPSGDASDFDGSQVQNLFSGGSTASVSPPSLLVSDAVTYAFDKSKPLVLSAAVTYPGNFASAVDSEISFQYQAGDVAATTDVSLAGTIGHVIFQKVEVFRADPPGNPTCSVEKSASQADPTSGTSILFEVLFNKGVTGLVAADIVLSDSTAGGTLVATIIDGLDGGLGYTVSVTGMLTAGNVIARIPASVCVDATANPNDASTSADNVVTWDPDAINPETPNVYEVCTIDRNMLRIEVRDPPVQKGYTQTLSVPDGGTGTYAITGAADNGFGAIRITAASYAAALGSNNFAIWSMANNGSGLIRCTMYDTSLLGASVVIQHAHGCREANGTWTITVINATTFDLVGSAFVNTYTGGGIIMVNEQYRVTIHSVLGCTEANGAWVAARSSATTIDLTDSTFTNAYTSGGSIIHHNTIVDASVIRPNPSLGGEDDYCHIVGRFGTMLRFQDIGPASFLDRDASIVPGDYTLSGGLTVTAVYRKSKPYSCGYAFTAGSVMPVAGFRHYLYLQLSGNLVSGTTYTLQFPTDTVLPPKTFAFNDKITRCAAIHVDQNGHRPGDEGKMGFLSEWVPDYGSHGEWDYSAITNWHLINSAGTVVWSAGAAPAFRVGPTDREGVSFDSPQTPLSSILLVADEGAALKVASITKANPGVVTVNDASGLSNGDVVQFRGIRHFGPGQTGPFGMTQVEDLYGDPVYYDVTNKSGNTFQLGCAKSVFSATVAAGGTGHAIGDVITLNNVVHLTVNTVSAGAITSVTPLPNESLSWFAWRGLGTPRSAGSGRISYPYTTPSNPQAQTGTTGSGSGATFNLTWANNPYDRTMVGGNGPGDQGNGPYGDPNTTAFSDFTQSTSLDKGNLLYGVNTDGNKGSTNVYGLDYSAASLTTGTYYIYIPDRGVSDPINISEAAWYDAATCYLKGLYNERSGCVLDGRFGFIRDVGHKSRAGFRIHKSYMSYALSNYTLYQVTYPLIDIIAYQFIGGGYDPWITTTEQTAFGGHVDAGDWDVRINETCWFYWQILDVYQRLPSAAQASLANQGTPTLLECGLDPVIFAGTNDLPSPVVEVIWGIELCRASQEVAGGVCGGINYGEGITDAEISSNTTMSVYSYYPDHVCTLNYALVAAKLAKVLGNLGYTSLASTYQTSAVAAYDWCTLMLTNTVARDAYYLPVKTRAGWTTPQYDTNMTNLASYAVAPRAATAAALFVLTGNAAYKTVCDAVYGGYSSADVLLTFGAWEYINAPGADAAIKTNVRTIIRNFATNSLLLYSEAPDVTYCTPTQAGTWAMNFGGANNFQYTQHLVMASIIYSDPTDPAYSLTNAARSRACLQKWYAHRHGANQIGLCMTRGLGVRNNNETLHADSRSTTQDVPEGLCSEGWANLFPILSTTLGNSFINTVQHPQHDPEMTASDPAGAFHELYPYDQLAWPRWEFFLEVNGAIEHSEFTVQQQIIGAYAGALYLHGWDDNDVTGEEPEPEPEPEPAPTQNLRYVVFNM